MTIRTTDQLQAMKGDIATIKTLRRLLLDGQRQFSDSFINAGMVFLIQHADFIEDAIYTESDKKRKENVCTG